MPTVTDATVVAQPYDTSGNGGRKLVQLNDKSLVAAFKSQTQLFVYRTIDNWNTKTEIWASNVLTSTQDIALATDGERTFRLIAFNNNSVSAQSFDKNGISISGTVLDSANQTALGDVSLAINEAKTELHAAWASKNPTLANSFNIRYAKGTINADGTVMWGAVEQRSTVNTTGADYKNPTITLANGKPVIIFDTVNTTPAYTISAYLFDGSSWSLKTLYNGGTYTQSSPSVIFLPQTINGLANGLVANAWHGTDLASGGANYIRFSKSIDGGATWSTMRKLVPGTNASLTANNKGKLFITYEDVGVTKCIESTDNGENWGSPITVGTGTNPSTLFDLSMQISIPLTIYKGTSSVLFSGSWTASSISPPQGDRGIITIRQSMMTYAITSDGTIGTVTEKINGVTVGTKTLASGQNTTISITQAQWDNIKYGKYKDVNANRNTITIEAQGNTYTYAFDKEPASTSDIISQTKAVKDSAEISMPAKKKILSDAINAKGGSTVPTDSIENMALSISSSGGVLKATGSLVASSATKSFTNTSGGTLSFYYVVFNFSSIPFTVGQIILENPAFLPTTWFDYNIFNESTNNYANCVLGNGYRVPKTSSDILEIPVYGASSNKNFNFTAIQKGV